MNSDAPSRFGTLRVVLAMLFLHVLTAYRYPWEDLPLVPLIFFPSPDFVVILAVGFALVLRFGDRALFSLVATFAFVLVPLYRFGTTVLPVFYRTELDTYHDVMMFPSLVHLLLHSYAPWQQVALVLLTGGVLGALYWGLYRTVRCALRSAAHPRWGYGFLIASQVLVLPYWTGFVRAEIGPIGIGHPFLLPHVVEDVVTIPSRWREDRAFEEQLGAAQARIEAIPSDLARLDGADVYLVFIESYGMTLFRDDQVLPRFTGWAEAWNERLHDAGFAVCSGICFPSISGGNSSLAHAELVSGVRIENRNAFQSLLESSIPTLPRRFTEAGYRTYNVQPATTRDWPEGKYFGYSEDVFYHQIPYRGFRYHWGEMPDQHALHHVLETIVRPAPEPVFLQYVSVTSHAPFSTLPPFYEDWSEVGAPDAFAGDPVRSIDVTWATYSDYPQLKEAYLDVIEYSLKSVVGFAERLPRPSLVIVLGDHQPPYVNGLSRFDYSRDVPLHVIANDEALLAPFLASRFTPGFVPAETFSPISNAHFLTHFLTAFSAGEAAEDR